ncbi:MAG: dienelactone hydrolase family protein [bacterium]
MSANWPLTALAHHPAAASASRIPIRTDTIGLGCGHFDLPVGDETIPTYYARPAGPGRFPVVLVVMEIFGLHEYIQDTCRRLAKSGYLAIAPDLLIRQGDVTQYTEIEPIRQIAYAVPDAQMCQDLDAAVEWAASGCGEVERLAVTGFCWGGRAVWMYAAHRPQLCAGVAWYGKLSGEHTEAMPEYPVDVASRLNAPVLGLYGGQDAGIPLDSVEAMQARLGEESASRIIVYPEAEHGFHADYRASYAPDCAQEGWREMLRWFQANGV